ncbi:SYG [Hepatospora eriocheir]|uniref:glycine--tRNA ligase n=1 Tax=Hepatospora eriocheir TaxID=1081669 RepID=A0A1X0QJC5_9MICR|nr:SYG [Hepatospora eriocheir]
MIDENMYEIDASVLVPYDVLKNSGHVDRFCDIVLTDGVTTFRADHLIEEKVGEYHMVPININEDTLKQVDKIKESLSTSNLTETLKTLGVKEQNDLCKEITNKFDCYRKHINECTKREIDFIVKSNNLKGPNGEFLPAKDFNLIFKIDNESFFLRPELAQSQFTNFDRIYKFANGKFPLGSFSIGKSYRNEINAKGGMLRTKEFIQAEIEYFTLNNNHPNFIDVSDLEVCLLPNNADVSFKLSLKESLEQNIICSESIAYFIGKAYLFLLELGFDPLTVRFRQHKPNEMAHYANECWDAEVLTLSGWIECAGIADRGCFDLTCHKNNINSMVNIEIPPKKVKILKVDKKSFIKELKSLYDEFEEECEKVDSEKIESVGECDFYELEFKGKIYKVPIVEKEIKSINKIPNVIEPSFGISRILYALIEQKFIIENERFILALKPSLCYKHLVITTLRISSDYNDLLSKIRKDLKKSFIRYEFNNRSCSIGRRYATSDELGIPYFATADPDSLKDHMITLRDRDSTQQVRILIKDLISTVEDLVNEKITWESLFKQFGI